MSTLKDNLYRMSRTEWNNLAKNPYCDVEIQTWIAVNGHTQARYYLAENESLCDEARDVLLAGRSNLVKSLMVQSGVIKDEDTIRAIYESCRKRLDSWRITSHFVSSWRTGHVSYTPSDVLEDICDRFVIKPQEGQGHWGYSRNLPIRVSKHPNCSLRLAIQFSQDTDPRIQSAGMDALVRISKDAQNNAKN